MGMSQESAVEGLLANRSKLLAYIWALLRDHHDTEDVFEETMILVMKNAAQIEGPSQLMAWARRAARSRAIDHLRREKRRVHTGLSHAECHRQGQRRLTDSNLAAENDQIAAAQPPAEALVHARKSRGKRVARGRAISGGVNALHESGQRRKVGLAEHGWG